MIPKSGSSDNAQGFRPIALCNVIYKILATLIAKRLKPLLPNIISPEQTGFVEGRKILDGIVVSQKMIHSLNQKKQKGMMIKLDLSKAYDHLSWKYLRAVLGAYGFGKGILFLRDPISPFLFIMAVEGLGRYFKKELTEKKSKA